MLLWVKTIETDATQQFVRRFVGFAYLAIAVVCLVWLFADASKAGSTLLFVATIVVTTAVWVTEIGNAYRSVRIWTWLLAAGWTLTILFAFARFAPALTTIHLMGHAEMFIALMVGMLGFPTSFGIEWFVFFLSRKLFGIDYATYLFEQYGPSAVVVADCSLLFMGAAIQWSALALWRRHLRRPDAQPVSRGDFHALLRPQDRHPLDTL